MRNRTPFAIFECDKLLRLAIRHPHLLDVARQLGIDRAQLLDLPAARRRAPLGVALRARPDLPRLLEREPEPSLDRLARSVAGEHAPHDRDLRPLRIAFAGAGVHRAGPRRTRVAAAKDA